MVYGSTMTKSIYEEQAKRSILVSSYVNRLSGFPLTYSEDELEEAYAADRNTYDVVTAQYVRISGAAGSTDEEGNENRSHG